MRRRYAAERRFRLYGVLAVSLAGLVLVGLLGKIAVDGWGAFFQHVVTLEIDFDPEQLGVESGADRKALSRADYALLVKKSLRKLFPDVTSRSDKRALNRLVSGGAAYELRTQVMADPALLGTTRVMELPLSDTADLYFQGLIDPDLDERDRKLGDAEIGWLRVLEREGRIHEVFNWRFLSSGDSREPELAGLWGAVVGSFLTLVVTLALCFPLGVATAIYLEEFSPRNRWTDFVEVNINNLAAVPSIVFGLLGLAVFLNVFELPRSAPLVGGIVLALMTLPTIIISSRVAVQAVPPSVREAALGVGASPIQAVFHHVLPLALPGMLTGTIIGMARALGETAPLLMIGMVAFIVDVPTGFESPSTVLPVQIYLWADSPERAFAQKTSGAILVLLGFLVLMNALAVILRNRFEKRW